MDTLSCLGCGIFVSTFANNLLYSSYTFFVQYVCFLWKSTSSRNSGFKKLTYILAHCWFGWPACFLALIELGSQWIMPLSFAWRERKEEAGKGLEIRNLAQKKNYPSRFLWFVLKGLWLLRIKELHENLELPNSCSTLVTKQRFNFRERQWSQKSSPSYQNGPYCLI